MLEQLAFFVCIRGIPQQCDLKTLDVEVSAPYSREQCDTVGRGQVLIWVAEQKRLETQGHATTIDGMDFDSKQEVSCMVDFQQGRAERLYALALTLLIVGVLVASLRWGGGGGGSGGEPVSKDPPWLQRLKRIGKDKRTGADT